MSRPKLIIVTGMPGTGKTTLANKISQKLQLPSISKDAIKEIMFDTLGWSDRDWSRKVSRATFGVMDYFIEQELAAGKTIIVECNFQPELDNTKFQQWQNKYEFKAMQLLCFAEGEVLLERWKQRAESKERHPGHVDSGNLEEFKETLLKGKCEPIDIKGGVVEVDTTDFSKVDEVAINTTIGKFLESS